MLRAATCAKDLGFTGCPAVAAKAAVKRWQVLVFDGGVWSDEMAADQPRSCAKGRGTTLVVEKRTKCLVRYDCRYPARGVRQPWSAMFSEAALKEWPSGRCGAFVLGGRRVFKALGQGTQYAILRGDNLGKWARTEYQKAVRSIEDDAAMCFGGSVRFEIKSGPGSFETVVVPDGFGLLEANSGARRLLKERDPRMMMRGGALHFGVLNQLAFPASREQLDEDPSVPRGFPGTELLKGRFEAEHTLVWDLYKAGVLEDVFGAGAVTILDQISLSQAERRAKAAAELLPPSSYPPCIRAGLGLDKMMSGKPPRNLERYVAVSSVCAALKAAEVDIRVIFSGELLDAMLSGLRRCERDPRTAEAREKKFLRMLKQLGSTAAGDAKEMGCRRIARETSLCPYGGDSSKACHGVLKPSAACGARGEKRPVEGEEGSA